MSTDRDTTRIVRSWLEEGVTALPDRVLDSVLDQVPATPQRRSSWPARRSQNMNRLTLTAVAAAAVLAVAVLGYKMFFVSGPGGPTLAPPAPTVVPTSAPPSSASATVPPRAVGPLAPGTHRITENTYVPYDITVPAGWRFDEIGFISKGDHVRDPNANGVAVSTWYVSHVYGDSCDWQGTLRPAGTRELMVAELGKQIGHTTSPPSEATFGGDSATRITLSLSETFKVSACDGGAVRLWPDLGPDEGGGLRIYPGQRTTVFVMEQGGKTLVGLVIEAGELPRGLSSELEDVVSSIAFQH